MGTSFLWEADSSCVMETPVIPRPSSTPGAPGWGLTLWHQSAGIRAPPRLRDGKEALTSRPHHLPHPLPHAFISGSCENRPPGGCEAWGENKNQPVTPTISRSPRGASRAALGARLWEGGMRSPLSPSRHPRGTTCAGVPGTVSPIPVGHQRKDRAFGPSAQARRSRVMAAGGPRMRVPIFKMST